MPDVNATLEEILTLIQECSADDLPPIYDALKRRRQVLDTVSAAQVRVGQLVQFDAGRGRGQIHGKIQKVNRTKVLVMPLDDFGEALHAALPWDQQSKLWSVPPSILSPWTPKPAPAKAEA